VASLNTFRSVTYTLGVRKQMQKVSLIRRKADKQKQEKCTEHEQNQYSLMTKATES
jgi:hypothetical protein